MSDPHLSAPAPAAPTEGDRRPTAVPVAAPAVAPVVGPVVGPIVGPIVLDGGMSNALQERGHVLHDALWTARVLWQRPDEVAAVHRAYYRAGARVATTASYQASVPTLMAAGLDRVQAEGVLTRSVAVARQVRDELGDDGVARWVAASVGPYGAVLADGSEYRGHYGLSPAQLREFHRPRLEVLAAAGPDLLAVETIPDLVEAEVLAWLLEEIGLPAWFSFSCRGGRTSAGQPLADAFPVAASPPSVLAVGVNCCPASDVLDAVRLACAVTSRPAVAYPNGAGQWDAAARDWRAGADADADARDRTGRAGWEVGLARAWVAAGAAYVGGCCQVGPREIARLAAELAGEVGQSPARGS